jgi:hypothetical protein
VNKKGEKEMMTSAEIQLIAQWEQQQPEEKLLFMRPLRVIRTVLLRISRVVLPSSPKR